ncbi:MAG: hypothetical protein JSV86_09665 [Gemmatimonadota bacterium]|nr:MAG: hypothetical protein JSV86_09665 [Gemmatimonadota bacterium]
MTIRAVFPLLLAAGCAFAPVQATAQVKLLGNVGLGRPLRPLDARARALGGSAVVLHGGNLSAVNPASLSRIGASGIWLSYQPEKRTIEGDLASGELETADFPLFRAVLPMSPRWVAAASFGGLLDRDWGVQFTDTMTLSTGDVPFDERRTSDGGISQFRLEGGYILSPSVTVGAALQYYFGESRLEITREFPDDPFLSYVSATALQYTGWGLTLGTEFQPSDEWILGAVVTWNSRLDIRDDSTGAKIDVGLPIGVDVGLSWLPAPELLIALAGGWMNWSSLSDDLPDGNVADSWRLGGGIELRALQRGTAWTVFLRVGASFEKYPFELEGGAPTERAYGLGLGVAFFGGRGRFDSTVEFGGRGDRDTNNVEESFTRYTFSAAVFTN